MIAPLDDAVSEQLEIRRFAEPPRSRVTVSSASGESAKSEKTEQADASGSAAAATESVPPDELPEEFELTPEIIEDEAIRNDFMLRLAVVLLAVLLACTQIGETMTLVHIKTGQYLTSHGILPPRTDVLTNTAAETPWINLSWFFDLFSALTYAIGSTLGNLIGSDAGGAVALTVVKTILAGLTFFLLLRAVRRDVPTWWASICAGLALIVCAEQLTFEPQLITLLGLSITLWIVFRWQQADGPKTLWGLVPLFIVWSNMDPRAFLGLVALMLLTIGELIGMFLGRSILPDDTKRSQLWLIVPVSMLAFLIHPFGWQTLLSPAHLYGTVYPALREIVQNTQPGSLESYLPLTDLDFWRRLTLPVIAALVLAATVPVTFILNWRNLAPAHVLLYLGMVGFGLANSYDLAAASLVFAALAALNAQMWYAASFRQSYSIEMSERVFSVGGRAVTAFAFFGLAFLAISGRLLGGDANRLGFGFRQSLAMQIEEIQKDLEQTEIPGQGLNFSRAQGDVLIWLDRKPFIDSRLSLHARGGEDSPLAEFRAIAGTWNVLPREENESQEDWNKRAEAVLKARRDKLTEHEIAHVIVPLGPRVAHYGRLRTFYADGGEWRLVRLGSMAGWFYRLTPDPEQNRAYLEEHAVDFFEEAFKKPVEAAESQPSLASSPSWTDKLFLLKANKPNSPETQLALHHRRLMLDRLNLLMDLQARQIISVQEMFRAMALANLAIRHSHNALRNDPNAVMAYQALADSCNKLDMLENGVAQIGGGSTQPNRQRRYFQSLVAYNQAIVANPELPMLHLELGNLYSVNGRLDLAAREFERFLEITGVPDPDNEDAQSEYEHLLRIKNDLDEKIEAVQREIDGHLEKNVPSQQLAGLAKARGCVLLALDLLKQEGQLPQNDPFTLITQLEAGDVEAAYVGLMQLDGQLEAEIRRSGAGMAPNPDVRNLIALAALSVGDYDKAVEQWTKQADEVEQRAMLNLMGTLPMVNRPVSPTPLFMHLRDDWQFAPWMTGLAVVQQMPTLAATPLWNAALCHVEMGQPEKAVELCKRLLEVHPETAYRPVAAFYIELITGEAVPLEPPSMYIPVWEGMFAPGPALAEKPIRKPEKPETEEIQPEKSKP